MKFLNLSKILFSIAVFSLLLLPKMAFAEEKIITIPGPSTVIISLPPDTIRQTTTIPKPSFLNKISWSTPYAWLQADGFYILVNGQKFLGNQNVKVNSDPVDPSKPYATTLEATWNENGVEMRLNLYFAYTPGNFWQLTEIRTYNGKNPGDWIYYYPQDKNGQPIQHEPNQTYINNTGPFEFLSTVDSKDSGVIYLENFSIKAFPTGTRKNPDNPDVPVFKKEPSSPSTTPSTIIKTDNNENPDVNKLDKKVADLEQKLEESKKQQSFLEQRINDILTLLKRLIPFIK